MPFRQVNQALQQPATDAAMAKILGKENAYLRPVTGWSLNILAAVGLLVDGGTFDWFASGKFPELTEPYEGFHNMVFAEESTTSAFLLRARREGIRDFGAFVEIADGVEGLCHNSEAVDESGHPLKLEPGQEFEFKILKMNPAEKKVGLSLRAVGDEATRADIESYKHPASSATTTLGEMVSWKRAGNDNQ